MSKQPRPDFQIHWFEEVSSTNDLARAAAQAGEPDGSWFVARRQTAGRGRQGRSWRSPMGNFYGSLLLRTETDLAEAASLSLLASLAIAEAVFDLSNGRLVPRLKWPNDVLLQGAKLAGTLLEGGQQQGGRGCWVVIGMGVNLAHHPADINYAAISLAAAGCADIGPSRFLEALGGPLGQRLELWRLRGFAGLRHAWLDAAVGIGAEVRLRLGDGEHRGRFADLGNDGSILIENALGCLERFSAGELFFAAQDAPISASAR